MCNDYLFIRLAEFRFDLFFGQEQLFVTMTVVTLAVLSGLLLDIVRRGILPVVEPVESGKKFLAVEIK